MGQTARPPGTRPTTSGGHIAVVDAMRAQFSGVPELTSLDRLRRRRVPPSTTMHKPLR